MNHLFIESAHVSLNKHSEPICGDFYTIVRKKNTTTIVLSDGLGSGVKANILATLTAKMLSTMMARNIPIEECVYTMAKTLPVCKRRNLAYSTFTILQVKENSIYLAQYDNPKAIFLRDGKRMFYPVKKLTVDNKEIWETEISLQEDDTIVLMTDGVTSAGLGKVSVGGWRHSEIVEFLEEHYQPELSPQRMAAMLIDRCYHLYQQFPDDDTTALIFKARRRQTVNLMIGPPEHKEDDEKILNLFFSKEGKHVVCGGTTATTVSGFLQKPIQIDLDSGDENIPPLATIEGVDLVTEGVITLQKVVDLAEKYISDNAVALRVKDRKDAVSYLAEILFEEATDIHIFFGQAVNPTHQELDIDFTVKKNLVKKLESCLSEMGKKVTLDLC